MLVMVYERVFENNLQPWNLVREPLCIEERPTAMNNKHKKAFALLAALALVLAACSNDNSGTAVPGDTTTVPGSTEPGTDPTAAPPGAGGDLAGTRWVATDLIVAGAPADIVANAEPTLDFSENGVDLGGTTGCNSYFASYSVDGVFLVFGGVGMTEMACEEPLMEQEADVLAVFAGQTPYAVGDGTLTVGDPAVSSLVFVPRNVAFPDAELTGTQWIGESIITGDAVSTMVIGSPVTMTIDAASSSATGSTGCNDYNASVEWSRTEITFGSMEATERGCTEPGVMEQEGFVLELLQGELVYTINGDRLTILEPGGINGLNFVAGP